MFIGLTFFNLVCHFSHFFMQKPLFVKQILIIIQMIWQTQNTNINLTTLVQLVY